MSTTNGQFVATNWKPYIKNTLQGFFSLELPSGMVLHGLTYHAKNDSRWVGLPGQKYTKADGTASYTPVVEFATEETRRRFQERALDALDRAGVLA